jgi:hypothetical protein
VILIVYSTFFYAISTILPIEPTRSASGHTIVARTKNTGSSPIPDKNPSPDNFTRRPGRSLLAYELLKHIR